MRNIAEVSDIVQALNDKCETERRLRMRGIKISAAVAGILLSVCLFMPVSQTHASEDDKGKCGRDVYWAYDWDSATLTISGQGAIQSCGWKDNEKIYEGVRKVVIGEGVTSICHSAFSETPEAENAHFLEAGVQLPSTLQIIGDEAFAYSGLREIVLPAGLQEMGSGVFRECTHLKNINFPEHLTRIEKETFSLCEKLETLTIPSSITYIGDGAFEYCDGLKTVTLPDSVEEMGSRVFQECFHLQTVKWAGTTQIPSGMFYDCRELKTVELPQGLLEIQDSAFQYCSQLENLSLPESVRIVGKKAFSDCVSLRELSLPEDMTSLGEKAFEKCVALKKIVLPEKLKTIPKKLFSDCVSLKSIHIPGAVRKVEKNAFEDCASIRKLTIPAGVKKIAPCHQNCPGLRKIINHSRVSYSLEASKLVMDWYRGKKKVTVVKAGKTVTGKGKKFRISYDNKQLKKYKITMKGKLPGHYTYGKEPKLPRSITAGKKNHCFVGWRYKASGKKFQSGAMRTWYNAYVTQFSRGIKGNIKLYPMVWKYKTKYVPKSGSEEACYRVETQLCDKGHYRPAEHQEFVDRKSPHMEDWSIRYEDTQVQSADNKKMKNKQSYSFGDAEIITVPEVKKGKTYAQFRIMAAFYWGVPYESSWSQTIKL